MKDEPRHFIFSENRHELMPALLDAYLTKELDPAEVGQVEQHLQDCSVCQQLLNEIESMRKQFARLTVHDVDEQYQQERERQPLRLADMVMKTIFTERKEGKHMQHRFEKLRTRRWGISVGIAVALCAILMSIFILPAYINRRSTGSPTRSSVPLILSQYWLIKNNQMTLKTKDVTFAIKNIDISHQEFRFFYALKSPQKVSLHAVSLINQTEAIPLATHDQILGTLGAYTIGVLHVHRIDRVGQVITIQITFQGMPTVQHLASLQQGQLVDKNPNTRVNFSVDQEQLADIIWFGPLRDQQVAFFKSASTSRSGSSSDHIFLRLDNPITVITISKEQYLAIAGPENYS